MGLGLIFTMGCHPMDDIHAEIDLQEKVIVGSAEYTLTDEDYDDLDLGFGSFSNLDDAKSMLPPFFAEMFPIWGKGSSILSGFQLYIGNAPGVGDYTYADQYPLTETDYALSGSDVDGFYPDAYPEEYLANILGANMAAPTEDDIVLAKYKQYTEVPVKTVTSNYIVEENFNYGSTAGDLTAITSNWDAHSGAGSLFVGYDTSSLSMADYPSSGVGGSATITPSNREDIYTEFTPVTSGTVYLSALVNLSTVGTGTYFFHLKDDAFNYRARIGAKDDGSGKILFGIGASSTPSDSDYGTTSYDLNTTYLLVGSYNIDTGVSNLYVLTAPVGTEPGTPEATSTGSSGLPISTVAFRQDGDGVEGPTATIDGVRVATSWNAIMVNDVAVAVDGDYMRKEIFYTYSGSEWEESEGVYFVSDADFDSMGEESGQPGRYNNFGSSTPPDDYLPTFLGIKYPYALEEDELFVIYDYFSSSSGAQIRGNLYTVIDGAWVGHQSTISTTLQFGYDGSNWVPDNTIKYMLTPADYDFVVDTFSSKYSSETANLAAYGNFNGFSWTFAMIDEAIGAVLLNNFPGAAEGQKYVVTYSIYDGSTHDTTTSLILSGGVYVSF